MKNSKSITYEYNTDDVNSNGDGGFILNLPRGFVFESENCTVLGFDTLKELKSAIKYDVISCNT